MFSPFTLVLKVGITKVDFYLLIVKQIFIERIADFQLFRSVSEGGGGNSPLPPTSMKPLTPLLFINKMAKANKSVHEKKYSFEITWLYHLVK